MSQYGTDGNESGAQPEQELPPLGAVLRAARESRGESLSEVARALKLSVRQLEAIEEERFDELPGPAFVKGFVRNYGRHLGVDIDPMVAARWGVGSSVVELVPMANADGVIPVSGEPSRLRKLFVPALLVLVLGGALAWYFDGFDPNSGVADSEQVSGAASGSLVEPEAEGFGPMAEEGAVENPLLPQEPAMVLPPSADAPALMPLPEQLLPPEPAAPEVSAPAPAAAASDTPVAVSEEAETEVTSGPGRLVFRLQQESWLEVRDNRDRRLYSGVGSAGSVRVVQGQRPFTLVIGNAAGVRVEHAGRDIDLAPHTSSGGVARLTVE